MPLIRHIISPNMGDVSCTMEVDKSQDYIDDTAKMTGSIYRVPPVEKDVYTIIIISNFCL